MRSLGKTTSLFLPSPTADLLLLPSKGENVHFVIQVSNSLSASECVGRTESDLTVGTETGGRERTGSPRRRKNTSNSPSSLRRGRRLHPNQRGRGWSRGSQGLGTSLFPGGTLGSCVNNLVGRTSRERHDTLVEGLHPHYRVETKLRTNTHNVSIARHIALATSVTRNPPVGPIPGLRR